MLYSVPVPQVHGSGKVCVRGVVSRRVHVVWCSLSPIPKPVTYDSYSSMLITSTKAFGRKARWGEESLIRFTQCPAKHCKRSFFCKWKEEREERRDKISEWGKNKQRCLYDDWFETVSTLLFIMRMMLVVHMVVCLKHASMRILPFSTCKIIIRFRLFALFP